MRDNAYEQFKEIWGGWEEKDQPEYQLQVYRLKEGNLPDSILPGLLRTFHLPITIPDIIEQIGRQYGGGKFQIKIVDGAGKYVKSKQFEIAGLPNDGSEEQPVALSESFPRTMIFRNAPTILKGVKIGGFLEARDTSQSIDHLKSYIEDKYGGGMYQIKLVDNQGKYTTSYSVDIAGFPKVPGLTDQKLEAAPKKVASNPKKARSLKDYRVGDKLTHKCGQLMTIEEVREDDLLCSWADPFGNAQKNVFLITEFKKSRSFARPNPKAQLCTCDPLKLLDTGCQCGGA